MFGFAHLRTRKRQSEAEMRTGALFRAVNLEKLRLPPSAKSGPPKLPVCSGFLDHVAARKYQNINLKS